MDAPARLEALLDQAEQQITRLVAARPNDPDLLLKVDRIREGLELDAGPYVVHVRERFTCILGSLGLIPADNEGEPCGGDRVADASATGFAQRVRPRHDRRLS
jgi:hypothetical protein